MNKLLIALLIGLIAGIIDVVPMIIQKLDKRACWSAFLHYLALGIIIPFIQWSIPMWVTGLIVALITSIPVMIIVYPTDKKAIIPMLLFSIILGSAIGMAAEYYIV